MRRPVLAKHALTVGTNYPGTSYQLSGCRADALDWSDALSARGYTVETLLDEGATRDAILSKMRALVEGADTGDRIMVTFSGHGTWVPDRDGDEADQRDEAICPNDLRTSGVITDDTLYEVFSQAKYGVRLVFVADSCYSGTIQRLAPPLEPGGLEMVGRQVRFLPPSVWNDDDVTDQSVWRAAAAAGPSGKPRRSALAMSGCAEHEVSYDAWFGSKANGAFTYAALQALKRLEEGATFRAWQREIRTLLPSVDYPQSPQLDGTSTQKRWKALT